MDLSRWKDVALRTARAELSRAGNARWVSKLDARDGAVHLAVFVEPWLSWLLDGSKTVESRFSVRRMTPWQRVNPGDIILLKASSGPVVGICEVAETWFLDTTETPMPTIRRRFNEAIGGDAEFWESVQHTRYVTLLRVRAPYTFTAPIECPKRDRRGWVTFA